MFAYLFVYVFVCLFLFLFLIMFCFVVVFVLFCSCFCCRWLLKRRQDCSAEFKQQQKSINLTFNKEGGSSREVHVRLWVLVNNNVEQ